MFMDFRPTTLEPAEKKIKLDGMVDGMNSVQGVQQPLQQQQVPMQLHNPNTQIIPTMNPALQTLPINTSSMSLQTGGTIMPNVAQQHINPVIHSVNAGMTNQFVA